MNDERFLKDWLDDTTDPNASPNAAADKVVARLPETSQRSRWWPHLPARLRTPNDDRPPNVTGRTRIMFSPAKAITAGALFFAIGGAFFLAQPVGPPSDNVTGPALAATGYVEPVEFTAVFTPMPGGPAADCAALEGVTRCTGQSWSPIISEMSDPRLDGLMMVSQSQDQYPGSPFFVTSTYRIWDDEGAWEGSTPQVWDFGDYGASSVVLVGEAAYEGLYAWMDITDWDAITGVIFPAPPPEAPTAS